MQKAIFPMYNMRITQGYGSGSHKGTYAIDNAGVNSGIESAYAPFDGVIKKVWKNGNTVWLESLDKVKYADGSEDYAVVSFTHDNAVDDLSVGQMVKQGTIFYQEGTAGQATGNHIHIECGYGKFYAQGWYLNEYGIWTINNKCKPEDMFFVNGINIINGWGYNWKYFKEEDMLTKKIAEILYRFYLKRAIKQHELDSLVGKYTADQVATDIVNSDEYKKIVQDAKNSGGASLRHYPEAIREIFNQK